MNNVIRIVGDCHGKISQFVEIVKHCKYSIQLGDMGFDYFGLNVLSPEYHKFIPGNHDNYDSLPKHVLGQNYGCVTLGSFDFFYVRGAPSIDKKYRILGISWWPEEELSYSELGKMIDLYKLYCPKVVLTHDCPASICHHVSTMTHFDGLPLLPSITSQALQTCLEYHQPERWYFGHYHNSWFCQVMNTKFRCLNELEYIDLNLTGDEL